MELAGRDHHRVRPYVSPAAVLTLQRQAASSHACVTSAPVLTSIHAEVAGHIVDVIEDLGLGWAEPRPIAALGV